MLSRPAKVTSLTRLLITPNRLPRGPSLTSIALNNASTTTSTTTTSNNNALLHRSFAVQTPGQRHFSGNVKKEPGSADTELPLSELVRDFLSPKVFYNALRSHGHSFYAGVPDSLLKDFCAYVSDHSTDDEHVITANEGNAIALAAGHYLGTGKVPIVYLQNSGLGNAVNPLLSLSDRKVCEIPMLLIIGWRGEPGRKDEPQHMVQGKITTAMLADLGIPFEILPDYEEGAMEALETAALHFSQRRSPYCLLVRKRTFETYKLTGKKQQSSNEKDESDEEKVEDLQEINEELPSRRDALKEIVKNTGQWDAFVATTGFTGRELYELRRDRSGSDTDSDSATIKTAEHNTDFLCVGSMGHASSIALGVAMSKPSRNIYCLDGDGAALMHLGAMAVTGASKCRNLKHVLINNEAHDSVGQQPTCAASTNFPAIASACGYSYSDSVSKLDDIADAVRRLAAHQDGPAFLEIKTKPGAPKDLGRPKESPKQNKTEFMEFLRY